MGQAGRYIDNLIETQSDRVIEAKLWGEDFVRVDEDGNCYKCLVGHAENWGNGLKEMDNSHHNPYRVIDVTRAVYNKVPTLFKRFGMDRMVRLFKLRAAKNNVVSIPTQIPATL